MAGSYSAIFDAATGPNSPIPLTVTQRFGESHLRTWNQDAPPRIVWVPPMDEPIDQPYRGGYVADGLNVPRIIHTRGQLWRIYFWGYAATSRIIYGNIVPGTEPMSIGIITTSTIGQPVYTVVVKIMTTGTVAGGTVRWNYSINGGGFVAVAGGVYSITDPTTGVTITLSDNGQSGKFTFVAGDTLSQEAPGRDEDQMDAAEMVGNYVLQALRTNMWPGYFYVARNWHWFQAEDELSKFGRCGMIEATLFVSSTIPATEASMNTTPITTARQDPQTGALELSV
jgi:hypothetical protein